MSAPAASPRTRAKGAGQDRSVRAFFPSRTRACGCCASGRTRAGPDKHSHAEWLVAHGDLANGLPPEMLLAGVGVDRDLICRQARQATGGPDPRLVRLTPKIRVVGLRTNALPAPTNRRVRFAPMLAAE